MRAIVAAVQRPSVSDAEFDASLTELRQLAKTLGFEVVGKFTQKRAGVDAAAYFGTGKREELKEKILENGAELILIDHEISPSQAFNLAKEVGGEVMDRTMVILEIFHRHARAQRRRIARRARPAQDPRPHGRAAARPRCHGPRAQDAARTAAGAPRA